MSAPGRPMMPVAQRRLAMALLAAAVALVHLLLLSAPPPGSGGRPGGAPPVALAMRARALPSPAAVEARAPPVRPLATPGRFAAPAVASAKDAARPAPEGDRTPAPGTPPHSPEPATIAPHALPPDPPALAAVPGPLTLRYQLSGRSRGRAVRGEVLLSFQHDGQRYEIRQEIQSDPPGIRLRTSVGRVTPQGLAPRRFGERRRGEEAVHFDAQQGRIVFSAAVPAAELLPGAQDRLSVVLQLGALIAAQPAAFGPGRGIAVPVASAREAAVWRFIVVGEEELDLPLGTLRTLHLVRPPQREFEPRLDLWLAPGRAYAPVRLRLTGPDGDWLEHLGLPTDKA